MILMPKCVIAKKNEPRVIVLNIIDLGEDFVAKQNESRVIVLNIIDLGEDFCNDPLSRFRNSNYYSYINLFSRFYK